MIKAIALLLVTAGILTGCTSSAKLNQVQTSNNYPNKLKLKALVHMPADLSGKQLVVTPSTSECAGFKAEIDAGYGYLSSIENGLRAAIETVEMVQTVPSPEEATRRGADLIITVNLQNESAGLSMASSMFSATLNSQFQISFNLQYMDAGAQSLYSYTANGTGFYNLSGVCADMAKSMQISMEIALKQVADNVSQSTYGAAQIREFEKARTAARN